ncbi:PTI1-like tyrosine-protein kinase 2 [Punica granatum]|uniref:PTI1-like tyrosine-protein kinase 2 n=1 Tax=Punica granatum TaxID=22663 RepID=A0A218X7L8_PUNGR|nr:PTI1-like tyrosine-protein kinase 2 [Punica granatum]OWM80679.1 hypothetical protein CDL15_Pgr006709 [Punica granatum]
MAPEWVYNLSITSKVDVYSYGIVLLEMVTGRSPGGGVLDTSAGGETENRGLTSWVKQKMSGEVPTATRIEEIVDHSIEGGYDVKKVEVLVAVALQPGLIGRRINLCTRCPYWSILSPEFLINQAAPAG